ncbi:MAG: acyl carrier protein [Candidatus Aminicenantes bacterium]|nr:acyl carrier protein [Candidatus Aminicenantes bacterium]
MPAEEEIREKLRSYVCREIMRREDYPLDDDAPLISGGLIDSFSLVHIAAFIEREFGVRLPDTDLDVAHMDTLRAMAARVARAMG